MRFTSHPFFADPIPLSTFILLAVAGLFAGHVMKRMKIPEISGQILVGVLLGPSVLGLFSTHALHDMRLITEVALGVMTFIAGTHLSFKKLHNASRRVILFASADVVFTFTLVFVALNALSIQNMSGRLLLAAISIATAPGTVIGLIQANKARGTLVKTLVGVVALNNVAAILAFEICKVISAKLLATGTFDASRFLGGFALGLMLDLVIGVVVGWVAALVAKHQHDDSQLFSTVILAILINVVLCQYFPLSTMLVNLVAGLTFANLSYHTRRLSLTLEGFNGLIFCVFFTLAGTHLNVSSFKVAGVAGVVYILVRMAAKTLGAFAAGLMMRVPRKITKYLGPCLIPQAGLAIGLVISLNEFDAFVNSGLAAAVTAVVLAAVVVNEIIGPFVLDRSFERARESGQSAPRLIDFLQEEYILQGLDAADKWDAIEKLCRFLVKTNHLRSITFDDVYQSVIEREKMSSTALGRGLAVPHARIPANESLMGVVGILRKPVDFDAPDGRGADIICLVATPAGKENLHVKMLGAISTIFMKDRELHDKLVAARNPAEAYDLLQSGEVQAINYFLDTNI